MAIWAEGGAARTALHALMGGAVSSITGGDFKSGAIAAGVSQAMAGALNSTFNDQPNLRQAFSQIVGLTAAGLAGADINKASWVALMADEYNRQLHQKEVLALEKLQKEEVNGDGPRLDKGRTTALQFIQKTWSVPVLCSLFTQITAGRISNDLG